MKAENRGGKRRRGIPPAVTDITVVRALQQLADERRFVARKMQVAAAQRKRHLSMLRDIQRQIKQYGIQRGVLHSITTRKGAYK